MHPKAVTAFMQVLCSVDSESAGAGAAVMFLEPSCADQLGVFDRYTC